MYVRWITKRTRHKKKPYEENILYVAYLVESKRVNGVPRQTALYLSSINEEYLDDVRFQRFFWNGVAYQLAPFQFSAEQRKALEAKLLAKVPVPTHDAWLQAERAYWQERKAFYSWARMPDVVTKINGYLETLA